MADERDPQDAERNMGNHLPLLPGNLPGPDLGGGKGEAGAASGAEETGGRRGCTGKWSHGSPWPATESRRSRPCWVAAGWG